MMSVSPLVICGGFRERRRRTYRHFRSVDEEKHEMTVGKIKFDGSRVRMLPEGYKRRWRLKLGKLVMRCSVSVTSVQRHDFHQVL